MKILSALLPYLPEMRDFLREVGTALGDMFVDVVRSLGNPTWKKFFTFFRDELQDGLVSLSPKAAAAAKR